MWAGLFVATSAAASAAELPARNFSRRSASPGPSAAFGRETARGAGGGDVSGPELHAPRRRPQSSAILLIPQRFHGIEPRGLHGRIEAEEDAHEAREPEGDDDRPGRDDALPFAAVGH